MNSKIYSNREFTELRQRINAEILRRGTYRWMDPLSTPKVGEDRTPPLSLPIEEGVPRVQVDDRTYTINTPSEGSIEPTKNIRRPIHKDNPGGGIPELVDNIPNSSAGLFTADELRNFIVGLSKIDDINLFYGRDEVPTVAFRDANNIENALVKAESDHLNEVADCICRFYLKDDGCLYMDSFVTPDPDLELLEDGSLKLTYNPEDRAAVVATFWFYVTENGMLMLKDIYNYIGRQDDPNGGIVKGKHTDYPVREFMIMYSEENGIYVMPSGELDGEEVLDINGLGPDNFFDDYGAPEGDGSYHPYNVASTPLVHRDWLDHNDRREIVRTVVVHGGINTATYGQNPRNPNEGNPYISKPIYRGSETSCNNLCTGLCFQTCDNVCSMSCNTTCFSRCGNACTSTCGSGCTGCSTMCYTSCKTKCENSEGYACVTSGARSVKVVTSGGTDGEPVRRELEVEYYTCDACSYSCQFYPNKKTTCWDAGCMSKCFVSCSSSCVSACTGGCIDNSSENKDYKTGKGRGCETKCTINCVGLCQGVCEGLCTQTCWHGCKDLCADNCTWECTTNCGSGCSTVCTGECMGCESTCDSSCKGLANVNECSGCSTVGGCSATCMHDCNSNCIGKGCKSICGVEAAGACESNCRINCMNASCTSQCSDACSSVCSTCANNCGWNCGACSSECSASCTQECGLTCTGNCKLTCSENCTLSCSEECGGCSNLCYSCVAMCIGLCSVKCQAGCSSCDIQCGWWCDTTCNQACVGTCGESCAYSCTGTCSTRLSSETTRTPGPPIPPTSPGYPIPENRAEEQESFILIGKPHKEDNE